MTGRQAAGAGQSGRWTRAPPPPRTQQRQWPRVEKTPRLACELLAPEAIRFPLQEAGAPADRSLQRSGNSAWGRRAGGTGPAAGIPGDQAGVQPTHGRGSAQGGAGGVRVKPPPALPAPGLPPPQKRQDRAERPPLPAPRWRLTPGACYLPGRGAHPPGRGACFLAREPSPHSRSHTRPRRHAPHTRAHTHTGRLDVPTPAPPPALAHFPPRDGRSAGLHSPALRRGAGGAPGRA